MTARRAGRIAALLLLFGAAHGCRGQVQAPAAQPGVDVEQYALVLDVDPEEGSLRGAARIRFSHADSVAELRLRLAPALEVDSVRVEGRRVEPARDGDRLRVPIRPADRSAEVFYRGRPDRGLYVGEHDGRRVLFTDSWPERARGWLPAVDHPSDPARFELTLGLPLPYEPIANGEPLGVDTVGGRTVSRWRLDAEAPVYSFAFAAGDFAVTRAAGPDTFPIRYVLLAPDSARADRLARTPEVLAFFARRIGPYAYPAYAVVQVPIAFAGMENASIPFLDASLFHDAPAGPGNLVEQVQVHEAAHQWFGDRVVTRDWRDLWLSEGMATYWTTVFYEETDGAETARRLRLEMTDLDAALARSPLVPPRVEDPEAFLTLMPYRKGGCVLHLLRLRLGDEPFFRAVRETYARFSGRPLSTEQFRALLEAEAGTGLDDLFAYWVYGDRVPVLHTRWEPSTRALSWRIEGDEGTLARLPFELEIRQGARTAVAAAPAGRLVLPAADAPAVRPVGVLMEVRSE